MNTETLSVYVLAREWQTLIGSTIALAAALLTVWVMRRTATADDRRHQRQTKRKEMAARAQMPRALSELTYYAEGVGRYLAGTLEAVPCAPTDALNTLQLTIEFIEDGAAGRTFELVSLYQIQRSRLVDPHFQKHQLLYDIVLLQAYVNSLFDYARNLSTTAPAYQPTIQEMKGAYRAVIDVRELGRIKEYEELLCKKVGISHPAEAHDVKPVRLWFRDMSAKPKLSTTDSRETGSSE